MTKFTFLFLFLVILCTNQFAQSVNYEDAKKVAENKLIDLGKNHVYTVRNEEQGQISQELYYAFELKPKGYVVVSSRKDLPAVIAYSFESNFNLEHNDNNPLKDLLEADIAARIHSISLMNAGIIKQRNKQWEQLLFGNNDQKTLLEYWPSEGTTSSGGWIESNWTQNAPYKNFCPMDPVTSQRSLVGCPATAMGMILEFFQKVNDTEFTAEDEYYHAYAGRNYQIDGDYEEHDFLSFPQINEYLVSITAKFEDNQELTNDEKAALSFACGVAAKQVYSSGGSGTFGVDQALNAYQKFGFDEALLLDNSNPEIFNLMSQNIKEARPVHLAVVNESWTSGHNVVVDGYNTDDYYHVNFGWGGSYNGWYLLPEELPYELTVIEGVIVNIAFPPLGTDVYDISEAKDLNLNIYPNPATDFICTSFEASANESIVMSIIDCFGRVLYKEAHDTSKINDRNEFNLDLNSIGISVAGTYVLKVETENNFASAKFVVY
ncbi:MAG: thiol protease/hemagglutinin PrtT [Bacteroidales bacterium]|nr:thiol protease/hemagglutinin PrtT [Bacteroidales bacterium]